MIQTQRILPSPCLLAVPEEETHMPVEETTSKTRNCWRCDKPAAVASAAACPSKTRTSKSSWKEWSAPIVRARAEGVRAAGLHAAVARENPCRSEGGQTSRR